MRPESHIDCSDLEALVGSRAFLNKELDRFLAWEVLTRYFLGKAPMPMQPSEFCDKIGVNPRFTNGINDSIRRKARRRNYGK
jgi:hypothetical protein